jgi:hypothetical protein
MTTYTIDVTQEDIDRGERAKCMRCPIARAMQRVFPVNKVSVFGAITWIGNDRYSDLPDEAQQFIMYFDEDEPVEPFSFTINLSY